MRFIDEHLCHPVDLVLRVLSIPPSTYYGWRARAAAPSRRQLEDAELLDQIDKIRSANEFAAAYGSPRVWLQLRRQGVRVGKKRVERIMRQNGLAGAFLRKGWKGGSTRQNPKHTAAPDLVDRDFSASAPNRLWVADLTRIPTGEGVLWLASVRDAFSNRVVGWKTAARADTDLVLTALEYALWSRDVRAGELIHHSDKGCQYTAIRFTPARRRRHCPLHRQRRGLLRQCPGREPVVDPQDRARVLARRCLRHPRRGRSGDLPLHRWLVQPAPHPGGSGWPATRRVRGGLLPTTRSTRSGYHPTRPSRSQITKSPGKRGNLRPRSTCEARAVWRSWPC